MFAEELQDVPVELEDIAISESTRLTDDHWETNLLLFPFFLYIKFFSKVLIGCNKPALPIPHNIVLQIFLCCTSCTCNVQNQSTAAERVFSETIARKPSWPTRQDLLPLMPIMMPTYTAPTRAIPTVKATWGISTVGNKDSSSVFSNFGSLSNLPGTNLFPALWPFLDCSSFGVPPLQARRTGLPGRQIGKEQWLCKGCVWE